MTKHYCALGWQHNIPSHLQHFEEVAYALAEKGYKLRTIPTKGASQAFIKGVQRYCQNRRKDINDYIEVYLPLQSYNGYFAQQSGFYNVGNFKNLEKRDKLAEPFILKSAKKGSAEERMKFMIPYFLFGEDLDTPPHFFITSIMMYDLDNKGEIIDGQGINGQAIRTLRKMSPNSKIFNFEHDEHRKRINSLIYYSK